MALAVTVRKQGETSVQLPFSFLFILDPSLWDGTAPCLGLVLALQLTSLDILLQTGPELSFCSDSVPHKLVRLALTQ